MSKLIVIATVALSFVAGCASMESPAAKATLDLLLQTVVLTVTPLLLLLVKQVIAQLEKKTGLAASAYQMDLLNQAVTNGIALAREQARKKMKLNEEPLAGEAKRDIALDFVLQAIREHKVPEVAGDYLKQLIEAQLNLTRHENDTEKPEAPATPVASTGAGT